MTAEKGAKSNARQRLKQLKQAHAAIGDDALTSDKRSRIGRKEYRNAGDIARLTEATQRRVGDALGAARLVLPQRTGEVGLDQRSEERRVGKECRSGWWADE